MTRTLHRFAVSAGVACCWRSSPGLALLSERTQPQARLCASDRALDVVLELPARERRLARGQHRLRQRPLLPRQPERPVGPRADAEPAELPADQRHALLELPHAADRATANDSLTIYSGLYGDRHGQPLTNSFHTYNPDGSTDPNTSFTYWTSPIIDTKTRPALANPVDKTPSMVYSDHVPATVGDTGNVTPAPWVPFTRAGCTVGDFSTANMVLENAAVDVPTAFGPTRRRRCRRPATLIRS